MPEGKGRFSLMLFIIRVHLCNLSADKGVFVANKKFAINNNKWKPSNQKMR